MRSTSRVDHVYAHPRRFTREYSRSQRHGREHRTVLARLRRSSMGYSHHHLHCAQWPIAPGLNVAVQPRRRVHLRIAPVADST